MVSVSSRLCVLFSIPIFNVASCSPSICFVIFTVDPASLTLFFLKACFHPLLTCSA
jgi:hypothetical protein